MPITAKSPETKFELVPQGNHVARCYSMIEIGTEEIVYQGEKKTAYKVRITWELPNEKKVFNPEKGEQPYSVSKDYTLSMHEKATLRHDLQNWRGKAFSDDEARSFDITKLIGKPCMLNIIHKTSEKNGNSYANIAGVTAIPKGLTVPDQINPSFVFAHSEWDDNKFALLPEWLRARIEKTPEFKRRLENPPVGDEPIFKDDDDSEKLPF